MSGRSAYVRKKITQTKVDGNGKGVARSGARSTASSEENAGIEFAMPARQDTGIGTTNARFLKFSEPIRGVEPMNSGYRNDTGGYGGTSSGSQSGGSVDGRQGGPGVQFKGGPLEDFAYARARRPNIRTEDVSGIEKSGLRSAVDRKSENVRRGLAKAFTFGKKHKNEDKDPDFRPLSAATVRPPLGNGSSSPGEHDQAHDSMDSMVAQRLAQQQQQQEHFQQVYGSPTSEKSWEMPGSATHPPPSTKLPPIPPTATAPQIRRWIGAGRPVQRWNKLRKDPELWDPNGDVLVFFGHKGQQPRPNPSFRLSSHIVEATESRYLITQLREGSTEEDIQLPPSPVGAPPMLQRHLAGGASGHQHQQHLGPQSYGHGGYGIGQPTPPISEDNSLREADGQISYEMYFPTPANMSKTDQLRYHITTRNVFALLYHASLVGLSLYQALSDLLARLEAYMPPETDNVGTIINYLGARGIDDVRNEPDAAVSILAWSESPDVRWEEGWRECFLHCAGMYANLEACTDFKSVTPITRALLERACLETQLRVQAAEERLADFHYVDMWPGVVASISSMGGSVMTSPAKGAADRLQKFLIAHYTRAYGRWPPLPPPPTMIQQGMAIGCGQDDDMWLTRTVAHAIQKDFAALYDYLVDRDIVWDGSEARSGRKWMLVSEGGNKAFEADSADLPMTDMLVEFDNRLRFPHIPHPYPLVPESLAGMGSRPGAIERRVQLAYTVATNMLVLGSEFTQSDLIDAFSKFEKTDRVGDVDPSTARRGRWVLIYGILQTLASVAVDALNVRYHEGVAYHLSPRLKGAKMPPWRSTGGGGDEAAHELSHCWVVAHTWNAANQGDNINDESSASSAGGGSGTTSPAQRLSSIGSFGSGGGYAFPRPSTMDSMTVRSGSTGYLTSYGGGGGRSVRSGVSVAAVGGHGAGGLHNMPYSGGSGGGHLPVPFGSFGIYTPSPAGSVAGGSSVMSEASSTRPLSSSTRRGNRTPKMIRTFGQGSVGAGLTSPGMGIGPVEEVDWPEAGMHGASSRAGGSAERKGPTRGLPPLPGLSNMPSESSSVDAFLDLDDAPISEIYSSYETGEGSGSGSGNGSGTGSGNTSGSEREGRRKRAKRSDRPLLSGDDETYSLAPVIRDFDDMAL